MQLRPLFSIVLRSVDTTCYLRLMIRIHTQILFLILSSSLPHQLMCYQTKVPSTLTFENPSEFRYAVRKGFFSGPTNALCTGYTQCNLVVLPKKDAFDFLLFCQRNKKACPLIEVCEVGSSIPSFCAKGADLKTDLPK